MNGIPVTSADVAMLIEAQRLMEEEVRNLRADNGVMNRRIERLEQETGLSGKKMCHED